MKVADATVTYCRPGERPPWGESWGANGVLGRKVHTRAQTHPEITEHMRDIGALTGLRHILHNTISDDMQGLGNTHVG